MTPRPIYYDTETTGLKPDKDRIIEIAAFDPVRNRSFEQLVHPGVLIPQESIAICHITNEMVQHAPSFAVAGQAFIDFCEGDVILIAHNNDNFDIHFLKAECERHALTLPSWKFLDSLKWARKYRPDLPKHTLQFLREMYGITANTAHRALDDVIVLKQVFEKLIDDLTITEVYNLLNKAKKLQHMPFGKHQGEPLHKVPKSYIQWLASSGAFEKTENKELKQSFITLGLL